MVVADHAARLARRKVGEVVTNAQLLAQVLLHAFETYHYDLIMVFTDTMVEAEALGCGIEIPDDDEPYLVVSPGLNRCRSVAAGPGRMPVVLEATRDLVAAVGKDVPVVTSMKGPFSLAAFLVGVDEFLIALRTDIQLCHEVLKFATEHQQRYADAIIEAGGIPFIGDPLVSGDIIGPRHFESFALPYLHQLIDHVRLQTRPVGLHVCGDTTNLLRLLRDTGADILSLDEVDLSDARRIVGNEIVLMGNVPTQLLHLGAPGQVREAARRCLAAAGRRVILSSACDVPRDSPVENVKALVDALHQG
jgi:uroporphyrinogen decarboxylase